MTDYRKQMLISQKKVFKKQQVKKVVYTEDQKDQLKYLGRILPSVDV